jgi:hypothetical protein
MCTCASRPEINQRKSLRRVACYFFRKSMSRGPMIMINQHRWSVLTFFDKSLPLVVSCFNNIIDRWLLGRHPEGGLLVIDAVGLQSMYFVVMPKVNLIVFLMIYVRYLYSINYPTVICLPSMLLFILWRDTTSELWTPV